MVNPPHILPCFYRVSSKPTVRWPWPSVSFLESQTSSIRPSPSKWPTLNQTISRWTGRASSLGSPSIFPVLWQRITRTCGRRPGRTSPARHRWRRWLVWWGLRLLPRMPGMPQQPWRPQLTRYVTTHIIMFIFDVIYSHYLLSLFLSIVTLIFLYYLPLKKLFSIYFSCKSQPSSADWFYSSITWPTSCDTSWSMTSAGAWLVTDAGFSSRH